ncbi:hypothetical protein [Streptomyces avicenniae]|uniref:hypothetical protein n=1 Tax=Streptomyces avicenniae TaxID=500153 RepID=UPI000A4D33E4|nr:hypothetical protein [Streptomyces avicenniae]
MRRTGYAAFVLVTLLVASAAAPAVAAEPAGCVPRVRADTEAGADRVLDIVAAAPDEAAADRVLAEDACLVRAGGAVGTAATGPVAVAAPDVYRIATVNGHDRWVAITDWDFTTVPPAYPMAGAQGVVTWFDRPVTAITRVMHRSGVTPQYPNVSTEATAFEGPYGIGFLMDAQVSATDTDVATGRSALVFEGTGACGGLTARGAFAHTWNSTDITALTVPSASGPVVTWTATTSRTLVNGPATTVSGVCG